MTEKKRNQKPEGSEVKIFNVPFSFGEMKKDITIKTSTPSKPSNEQIINQAFKFHSQGNINEATKQYQNLINQGVMDHRVFSNYGSLLKKIGKFKDAELLLRKATQIKPDLADSHYNLGNILKDLGKFEEAEISTREAIKIKPDFSIAHSNLGIILRNLGKFKEAEISIRKAIDLKPNSSNTHLNLGIILRKLGKFKEAEISTRKAINLKPDFAEAHNNLGIILRKLGNFKEAEISTRKAINLQPDYPNALVNLGIILRDLGNLKEAELFTRKAIRLNPSYSIAYTNLGVILIDIGNKEQAIKCWIKAIELNPKDIIPIKELVLLLCNQKKFELALQYLSNNNSETCESLHLGCLLSLDREEDFNKKYNELKEKLICNADIGGIIEHAKVIYNKPYNSPFCNEAIKYIKWDKIDEKLFSNEYLSQLINYVTDKKTIMTNQGILHSGVQTSGNLFTLDYLFIKEMKKVLELKIELYKQKFKNSGQGFIENWPINYELRSWMISMKSGGFLAPHNHEYGWITGSFYLQIPNKDGNKDEGSLAFSYQGPRYPSKEKDFNLTIRNIETRDICIFPSSLFHHTIPFASSEDRICFVFDLIPKS